MEFHPEKCEVLRVGRKRAMVQNDYILHGKTLATADSAKYLGVTIASDLRWNKHIDTITGKANRTLRFLKRNLKINSTALESTAYKTFIRPPLEFGIHTHRETSLSSRWCRVGQRDLFLADTTTHPA